MRRRRPSHHPHIGARASPSSLALVAGPSFRAHSLAHPRRSRRVPPRRSARLALDVSQRPPDALVPRVEVQSREGECALGDGDGVSLAVSGVVELVAVSGGVPPRRMGRSRFRRGRRRGRRRRASCALGLQGPRRPLVEFPPVEFSPEGEEVRAEVEAVAAGRAGDEAPWMRNTGGASRNASSLGRAASRASGASTPTHRPSKCASA